MLELIELYSVRNTSLGRKYRDVSFLLHPVKDASRAGCRGGRYDSILPSEAFLSECTNFPVSYNLL